ncbi:CEP295 N-terminal like [Phyllostomus discolor]|uniref:CEP295 N-terminal like n=1 Tax=Phyllostomus discolor TaxID=89673 RepID=A0A833ZAJ6_9CHIR|nr:CEP295 N-terminal like [Phyllostomus discolor]
MKRRAERAARPAPDPEDEAWLCRQRQRLLRVGEDGGLALRGRPDLRPCRGQRAPRLSEALWAEGWGAPGQRAPGLVRLHLAHLLGMGGGWAEGRKPNVEGLAHRGAAWERQRAAGRGEQCRREDPVRLKPCPSKFRRTPVGVERKGAGKVTGWPHPPPGHPEKHKGTGGSSRKTHGGCCPAGPRVSRGLAAGKLWTAAAGGTTLLGEREEDPPQPWRRQLGRTACLAPSLKSNSLGQCPQAQVDSVAPVWPVSHTHGGRASPLASLGQHSGKSRWQRELESAFQELFDMNRKLKRHLSLHLASGLGLEASPCEEQGSSEGHRRPGGTWREKPVADGELETGLAEAGASQASLRTSLQKALSRLEGHAWWRTVRPAVEGSKPPSSPGAGTPVGEGSLPWGHTVSRLGLPRLDTHPLQRDPRGQADRDGPVASRQKQKTEQRRPAWLELLEPLEACLEARGQTEGGDQSRAERRPRPAPSQAASSPDQEKEGFPERGPASPPATSSTNDDDSGHSQMIRDREQQILEQNKLHKQFLEEARKRLREFQSEC